MNSGIVDKRLLVEEGEIETSPAMWAWLKRFYKRSHPASQGRITEETKHDFAKEFKIYFLL